MPALRAYTYTTRDEIERIYSSFGASLRTQDMKNYDDTQYWIELTEEASEIVDQYCVLFYTSQLLSSSRWVRSKATWIACYLLSQRKAAAAQFETRYLEIIEELKQVRVGLIQIPGLATNANAAPTLSNVIVDDRHAISKIRVHQQISTEGYGGQQAVGYPNDDPI